MLLYMNQNTNHGNGFLKKIKRIFRMSISWLGDQYKTPHELCRALSND